MPYTKPGEDELFEWLTGETDATLREVRGYKREGGEENRDP